MIKAAKSSRLLSMESYVRGHNLIITKHTGESHGYVSCTYETSPLTGGGEELEGFISSALKNLPDKSVLQVHLVVAPDFETPRIYAHNKTHGTEMVQELVRQRIAMSKAASTPQGTLPYLVMTNFKKLLISLMLPAKVINEKILEEMNQQHDEFFASLKTSGFNDAKRLSPQAIIGTYRQFCNMFSPFKEISALDPSTELNKQVFGPNDIFDISGRTAIELPGCLCTAVVPKVFPEELELGVANLLIGSPFNQATSKLGGSGQRINHPHIITATVRILNQGKELERLTRAIRSREEVAEVFRYVSLGEESGQEKADLEFMKSKLSAEQEKYTKASLTYFLFTQKDERDSPNTDLATIKNLLNYQDFEGAVVEHNTGVRFFNSLPLNYSSKIAEQLDNEVDMPSSSACAILPVYGHWRGNANERNTGSLFWTPRGDAFFFDKFKTNSNMNGTITAQPGSGKGVLVNYMVGDDLANGDFVVILDNGNSYRKLCDLTEGEYITFDLDNNNISLNPFSGLNAESFSEESSNIAALLLKMACSTDAPNDFEITAMNEAVRAAWKDSDGRDADDKGIADVIDALQKMTSSAGEFSQTFGLSGTEQAARNLASKLRAFADNSRRNSFFSGPSNLKARKQFIVVELGGLTADPELLEVVLFYVLNKILQWVNKTNGRKIIYIDECHEILSKASAAKTVESLYRKARKEGGAMWIITHSLLDLINSEAGEAIKRATNWHLMLEQTPDAVQKLIQQRHFPQFDSDPYFVKTLDDTRNKKGVYSEILIVGPDGYEKVRHYLNPFMLMVYNTEQRERELVFELMNQGDSAIDAVEKVSGDYTVSRNLFLKNNIKHLIFGEGFDKRGLRQAINDILEEIEE